MNTDIAALWADTLDSDEYQQAHGEFQQPELQDPTPI